MLRKFFYGFIALIVAVSLGANKFNLNSFFGGSSCHRGCERPHERYLATKTPYLEESLGSLRHHYSHDRCEPLQIWMVVRHGTRNPSAKVINRMRTVIPSLRDKIVKAHQDGLGELCTDELAAITKWNPQNGLVESDEKILVRQGQKELKGIGRRFRERFPTLLDKPYTQDDFKFKFTKTERAEASCKHFVEEILGSSEEAAKVIYPEALAADPILRFYKGCQKWRKQVKKNPDAYIERKKFEASEEFSSVYQNIAKRFGLEQSEITLDVVESMYMTCAFETAWNPDSISTWCHAFNEEDLEKMQYRQDLEYYWIDGFGFPLTYKQACPAVADLVEHFQSKVNPTNKERTPSLIAYFTHSGTLLKLTSRLGLFNDTEPLLHSNFKEQKYRQFRTSYMDKFATNVAAVLYKCENGESDHRVGLFFQEQPVSLSFIEGSNGDDLCPLQSFLEHFKPIVQDCDMNSMCKL